MNIYLKKDLNLDLSGGFVVTLWTTVVLSKFAIQISLFFRMYQLVQFRHESDRICIVLQ